MVGGWQLISSHTTFMSTRLLTISGGMLGSRARPKGPASICGGDVPVGIELLVEHSVTVQQHRGVMVGARSEPYCGFEGRVAMEQRAKILF